MGVFFNKPRPKSRTPSPITGKRSLHNSLPSVRIIGDLIRCHPVSPAVNLDISRRLAIFHAVLCGESFVSDIRVLPTIPYRYSILVPGIARRSIDILQKPLQNILQTCRAKYGTPGITSDEKRNENFVFFCRRRARIWGIKHQYTVTPPPGIFTCKFVPANFIQFFSPLTEAELNLRKKWFHPSIFDIKPSRARTLAVVRCQ